MESKKLKKLTIPKNEELISYIEGIDPKKASDSPEYLYSLGLAYHFGINVDQKENKAIRLISEAADKDLYEAVCFLYEVYSNKNRSKEFFNPEKALVMKIKLLEDMRYDFEDDPSEKNAYRYINNLLNTLNDYKDIPAELRTEMLYDIVHLLENVLPRYDSLDSRIMLAETYKDVSRLYRNLDIWESRDALREECNTLYTKAKELLYSLPETADNESDLWMLANIFERYSFVSTDFMINSSDIWLKDEKEHRLRSDSYKKAASEYNKKAEKPIVYDPENYVYDGYTYTEKGSPELKEKSTANISRIKLSDRDYASYIKDKSYAFMERAMEIVIEKGEISADVDNDSPEMLFYMGIHHSPRAMSYMLSAAKKGLLEAKLCLAEYYFSFFSGSKMDILYDIGFKDSLSEAIMAVNKEALDFLAMEYKKDPTEKNALIYLSRLILTCKSYSDRFMCNINYVADEICDIYNAAARFIKWTDNQKLSKEGMGLLSCLYSEMAELADSFFFIGLETNEADKKKFSKRAIVLANNAYGGSKDYEELDALAETYSDYTSNLQSRTDNIFSYIKLLHPWRKSIVTYKKKLKIVKKLYAAEPAEYDYEMMSTYNDIANLCCPIIEKKYLRKALEMCKEVIKNDDGNAESWHESYDRIAGQLGLGNDGKEYGLKAYRTKEIERLSELIKVKETKESLNELASQCERLAVMYANEDDFQKASALLRKGFDAKKKACDMDGTFANKLEICNYLSRADFSFHNYGGTDNPVFKISEEILDCLGEVDLDSLSYEELCSIDAPYYVLYRAAEAANDKEKLAYYSEKVKYFEEKRKAREEE